MLEKILSKRKPVMLKTGAFFPLKTFAMCLGIIITKSKEGHLSAVWQRDINENLPEASMIPQTLETGLKAWKGSVRIENGYKNRRE